MQSVAQTENDVFHNLQKIFKNILEAPFSLFLIWYLIYLDTFFQNL
jgi:hypothetical protein